jgi:mannosyltransferase OCH1-like enzyme
MPHLLIQNRLSHQTEYDVLLFGYFLTPFSFLLHVKRFDSLDGWNTFEIYIDDTEKVIVEANTTASFIKIVNTTFAFILPLNNKYEQAIPKIIVQTSETSEFSALNKNCVESFAELNTEYSYQHFNSIERRNFIKTNYDEKVINAYDLLVSRTCQADLFIYCFLYKNGGCYFDEKIIIKKALREIISPTDTLILCKDYEKEGVLNDIIMTTAGNELFLKLIEECVKILHINLFNYDTGSKMMSKFCKEKEYKLEHIILNNDRTNYRNYLIIDKKSKDILFNKTNTTSKNKDTEWSNHQLLYQNNMSILNIKIHVYPHPYCDTFNFFLNNEKEVIIERRDSKNTWHFPVTLKIIENDTSKVKKVTMKSQRTLQLDDFNIRKPSNVFLSCETIKLNVENKVVVSVPSTLFCNVDKYKTTIDNAYIILTVTDLNIPLSMIESYASKCNAVILYNNSLSYYFCEEIKKPHIFIFNHILKLITNCYKFIPILENKEINQEEDYILNLGFFTKFVRKLMKENRESDLFLLSNIQMFYNIDYEEFYKRQFEKFKYIIEKLNEIVKECGECLGNNVVYDANFNTNKTFENKRKNIFVYSRLVTDILEIGFNAGHSTFLYLIANPISKIRLFDLGEHKYSRLCYDYLCKEFPDRLSIVWGNSVDTLAKYSLKVDYDLIHIDGGRFRYIVESDIRNCERLSSNETIVIVNDSSNDPVASFLYELIKAKYIIREKPYYDTKDHLIFKYA